jgi:hypothetical protein
MSGSRSSPLGEPETPTSLRRDADAVSLTVHELPRLDEVMVAQRTRKGRWQMLLVLAVCAAPVVASYLAYYVIRPGLRSTNYSELIQPTRTMPASLGLRSLQGAALETTSLRRQWLLVVAGPSTCAQACQDRLVMQRQLHQMLGKERPRVDKIWLLTDNAAPDAALLQGLTQGDDPVQVLRVSGSALAGWLTPAPGTELDDHLYVVDPMGEWMMRTPPKPEPQRVKRDLDRLLRASASWDVAGR